MSYVFCTDAAIDLLDRADALKGTDLFLTRAEVDRISFLRMYTEVDAYVTAEEDLGIDEAIIDDFDSLLTEWETALFGDDETALISFYEEVYA